MNGETAPTSPMFVLDRRDDARLARLEYLERYVDGSQHDHLQLTWWNTTRMAGSNYIGE